MNICSTYTHGISRQLKISRRCIRQTIRKYDKFHVVDTKPGGGRPRKVTDRDKRLIKLQQLRDESLSLRDFVRYTNTELNLSISISTISRILREYSLFSIIAPKKPRITARQRRDRIHGILKCLIGRIECISVDFATTKPDWSDHNSEFIKVMEYVYVLHIYQINECLLEIQDEF